MPSVAETPAGGGAAGEPRRAGLIREVRYFLGLGTWGFGGPIATVGYIQRDLVQRRGWLSERDFLDGVALGQTMPGPLAAQVVMWVGFLESGALGALISAMAFILPSLAIVVAVAVLYAANSGLWWVQALFYGIAPAVMPVIGVAAVRLARLTDGTDPRLWTISAIVALVTALTGAEVALLFVGAGLLMILLEAPPWRRGPMDPTRPGDRGGARGFVPLAVLGATATAGTLVSLGLFFLKAGAFIFGSGLAIVPFLREGVVNQHHWLTQQQFLDAVAMGLITPGPVVITAAFIGYLVAGFPGAIVATVAIFTPIYLGVVVPGPWFVRHRGNPQVKAFVRGATAAAAGAIAGATVVLTRSAVRDWRTALIAVVALGFVLRFKNREPLLVLMAAAAGLLLH
jgi:chromate transporter